MMNLPISAITKLKYQSNWNLSEKQKHANSSSIYDFLWHSPEEAI